MDESYSKFATTTNADGTTHAYGGITDDESNWEIMMNVNYDTAQNRLHEIFHTFGFNDFEKPGDGDGIMHYPPQTPNQRDANTLVNNGFLKKIFK